MAVALAAAGCSQSSGDDQQSTATALANITLDNTRNAPSSLRAATVPGLEEVWSLPLEAQAEGLHYIGSPVVDEGVVYLQDPQSNVEAIDLDSGELLWEAEYQEPANGPVGVTVGEGRVFGATPAKAFALDADTGEEVWSVELARGKAEQIEMTPGYHDGLVYFSTAPSGLPGGVGVLWALEAATGRKVWHFDTVPKGLWGHPEINYGGGVHYPPAFDGDGGMYVGVSHAGPVPGTEEHPWGASRPGPNLYAQSIVKLDEKTGKVRWHYQITPHAICLGYLVSPVLAEAGNRKVVLSAGVSGILVAVDQGTGKALWRRPLGLHNGHDNDGLLAMRGESDRLKLPATIYPGLYGGVAAPLSVSGPTAFVPIVNGATRLLSQERAEPAGTPTGELVAVDIGTGAVEWKRRFPASLFGPTTVTNDLVLMTASDGTVSALGVDDGGEVWTTNVSTPVEGGMTVTGDTLLVRTGAPAVEMPQLRAFRLAG
jgi:outer membrane protein assembly factor BamB